VVEFEVGLDIATFLIFPKKSQKEHAIMMKLISNIRAAPNSEFG
jgi:hypothetical protein